MLCCFVWLGQEVLKLAFVEHLRGTQGARFEGYCTITRRSPGLFDCFSGCRFRRNICYVLIKGPFCFVFLTQDSPSPNYAIGLLYMEANLETSILCGRPVVALQQRLGNVEYEFCFNAMEIATQFKTAIDIETKSAHTEAVRKRLGHDKLVTKRPSLAFAETLGKDKVSNQPASPSSNQEILHAMPPVEL
jgi:hypothetical protein